MGFSVLNKQTDSEWKDFAASYWFNGEQCGFLLMARNAEEAQERIRSLKCNVELHGEVIKVIGSPWKWWHRIAVPVYIWWYKLTHKEK